MAKVTEYVCDQCKKESRSFYDQKLPVDWVALTLGEETKLHVGTLVFGPGNHFRTEHVTRTYQFCSMAHLLQWVKENAHEKDN